jgi:hypothetical protein
LALPGGQLDHLGRKNLRSRGRFDHLRADESRYWSILDHLLPFFVSFVVFVIFVSGRFLVMCRHTSHVIHLALARRRRRAD